MANFVPEMHDIGKLVPQNAHFPLTEGQSLKAHDGDGPSFRNLNWNKDVGEKPPANASWLAVVYHIDKKTEWVRDLSKEPPAELGLSEDDRVRLFLTVLSDHLAATSGRVLSRIQIGLSAKVYRLWRPTFADDLGADPEPIRDTPSLNEALDLIRRDPADVSEFIKAYGRNLMCRAEDESVPRNVTSLRSHSVLTGQFYRALEREVQRLHNPLRLSLGEYPVSTTEEAEAQWVGQLVRATVRLHQNPVRPRDLRVFQHLHYLHGGFAAAYPDHVLFSTVDTLWLFLAGPASERLSRMVSIFTEAGFYVESEQIIAPLRDLNIRFNTTTLEGQEKKIHERLPKARKDLEGKIKGRNNKQLEVNRATNPNVRASRQAELDGILRELHMLQEGIARDERELADLERRKKIIRLTHASFYSADFSAQPAFDPPLCEICQVRPAREHRFGRVTDFLCDVCLAIRQEGGFQQRDLAQWLVAGDDEEGQKRSQGQVLWAQISLDARQMEETVAWLFGVYAKKLEQDPAGAGLAASDEWEAIKREMRLPALMRDFVEDYGELLAKFGAQLARVVGKEGCETLSTDCWVAMIRRGSQVYEVMGEYLKLVQEHFSALCQPAAPPSPLRLGVSVAPAKYPFYQHRRYTGEPPAAISVRMTGKEPLEVSIYAASLLVDRLKNLSGSDWEARNWKSYLHKLAAIAARSGSQALATATFLSDVEAQGREIPRNLHEFKDPLRQRRLRVTDLLAYAKVTTWK